MFLSPKAHVFQGTYTRSTVGQSKSINPEYLRALCKILLTSLLHRAEACLVIICGCIPPIKPLFEHIVRGKPLRQSGSAYPSKRSYQVHSSSNNAARKNFKGQSGNMTNVTTVDSDIYSTHPSINPKGIQVERGVEVILSDFEYGKAVPREKDRV